MCAPVDSRIALMLQPPLPITLLMADAGTLTFLDLLTCEKQIYLIMFMYTEITTRRHSKGFDEVSNN